MATTVTREEELTLQVEGSGNTRDQALGAAFANIKQAVGGTPLRIEPLEVEVVQAVEKQYTERFLFLFFKRTRSKYHLQLRVRVRVFSIDLEQINFQVERDRSLFR